MIVVQIVMISSYNSARYTFGLRVREPYITRDATVIIHPTAGVVCTIIKTTSKCENMTRLPGAYFWPETGSENRSCLGFQLVQCTSMLTRGFREYFFSPPVAFAKGEPLFLPCGFQRATAWDKRSRNY